MRALHRRGGRWCWPLARRPAAATGTDFDDALAKAPVLSVGRGRRLQVPRRGQGGGAADRARGARRPRWPPATWWPGPRRPAWRWWTWTPAGTARTHVATGAEIMDMAGEAKAAVKSAVELADGRVLLGTPAYNLNPLMEPPGRIYFLKLEDTGDDVAFMLTRGNEPGARKALRPGGGGGQRGRGGRPGPGGRLPGRRRPGPGRQRRHALVANLPTCPVNLDPTTLEKYRFRALGVGDLIDGGGDEIAIGVPREGTMPGKVVILVPGTGGLDCPLTITAPAMQPRFGNALLVTDVNGDGKKDLLVGAPPLRAYLYLGPFTAGSRAGAHARSSSTPPDGHPGAGRLRLPGGRGGHRRHARPGGAGVGPRSARRRRTGRRPVFAYKPDATAGGRDQRQLAQRQRRLRLLHPGHPLHARPPAAAPTARCC